MPLSMTLNRSNKTPSLTPCFDGKELHIDSELVSAGLSAISVKGCDAGDPRRELSIRHRNSFWSVHRPELSKLGWAYDHTTRSIENYLKVRAGNHQTNKEFKKSDIPLADFNQLTVIHADSNQRKDTDEDYLLISKPRTTQFSDDDLASYTTLHKSRAEFCVTIGRLGEPSISEGSEPSGSRNTPENNAGKDSSYENDVPKMTALRSNDTKMETVILPEQITPLEIKKNENLTTLLESHDDEQYENLDEKVPITSQEMLIALMDTEKDRQAA